MRWSLVLIFASMVFAGACEDPESESGASKEEVKPTKPTCVFMNKNTKICCPAEASASFPKDFDPGKSFSPSIHYPDKTVVDCGPTGVLKTGDWEENNNHGTDHHCERNGKLDGPVVRYHPTGAKYQFATYVDDKLEGESERWHENTQLEAKGLYKDGGRDGEWVHWDQTGAKLKVETWKAGKREGISTGWWDNDKVRYEHIFADGKGNGIWTDYWYSGQKQEERTVVDGLSRGVYSSWWGTGQIATRGQRVGDLACEVWECWAQDGTPEPCWEKKEKQEGKFQGCKWTKTGGKCPPCDEIQEQPEK